MWFVSVALGAGQGDLIQRRNALDMLLVSHAEKGHVQVQVQVCRWTDVQIALRTPGRSVISGRSDYQVWGNKSGETTPERLICHWRRTR